MEQITFCQSSFHLKLRVCDMCKIVMVLVVTLGVAVFRKYFRYSSLVRRLGRYVPYSDHFDIKC